MLAALLGLSAGSAQAQSRWTDDAGYYEGLSTRAIVRAVRARGLVPVSRVTRRGDIYYVNAADDYGRVRRVMVDAYSGRILRIEAAARPERGPGLPPMMRPRPRHDFERGDYAMRPPRVVPADPDAFEGSPRAERRALPPLRAPSQTREPEMRPQASLPPPPSRDARRSPTWEEPRGRSADEGPPPRERARTAATSPAHAPTPRPRPAAPPAPEAAESEPAAPVQAAVEPQPAPDATPQQQAPEGAARTPKPLPRVILPGGPLPKAERTAETRAGRRVHSQADGSASAPDPEAARSGPSAPSAPATEQAPAGLPPVQPLD
jgi:hypothetical protein